MVMGQCGTIDPAMIPGMEVFREVPQDISLCVNPILFQILLVRFSITSKVNQKNQKLEPVCCKKRQKNVPNKKLVQGIGDL